MTINLEIGGMRQLKGWVSLDNRTGINFNIITDEIPFPDERLDNVYMTHVIEHIPISCAEIVFRKIFQKLKKGGKFRVVCPDLEVILKAYLEKDISIFNNPSYQLGTVPHEYMRLGIGGCVVGQITTSTIGDENDSLSLFKKKK